MSHASQVAGDTTHIEVWDITNSERAFGLASPWNAGQTSVVVKCDSSLARFPNMAYFKSTALNAHEETADRNNYLAGTP